MTTETVEGAAITLGGALGDASVTAAPPLDETTLPAAARRRASLLGLAIGLTLITLALVAALLFTAATFGYSVAELL